MPLTRTRRRLLIATLLAVGLFVAWWVCRPRLDPRFVGSWAIGKRTYGRFAFWSVTRTYNADGTLQTLSTGHPGAEQWRWRVEGNVLVEYDATSDLPAPLQELYRLLTGQYQLRGTSRYEILSVSGDEIRLRLIDHPDTDDIRLERLDEPTFNAPP
jgi:hypothetical protein